MSYDLLPVRPGYAREDEAQGQCENGEQNRLKEELECQLSLSRANDLSHTHFPGPQGRPRGREIDKVDTGDEQDENANGREGANRIEIAGADAGTRTADAFRKIFTTIETSTQE